MNNIKKVSVRGGFSDRNKIKPLNTVIQFESLDEHSRNAIAILVLNFIGRMEGYVGYNSNHELAEELLNRIFNEPVSLNSYPNLKKVSDDIKNVCLSGDYDDVLTLVEQLCRIGEEYENIYDDTRRKLENYGEYYDYDGNVITSVPTLYDAFNELFEEEFIGYKFVDGEIVKITSQVEIGSIEDALKTPYSNVNSHIKKAISLIKENGQHDYKNAIKECSLALECLLNVVSDTNGLELGKALNKYMEKNSLHPALKQSISSFYGFTSDSSGIRHDTNKTDFNEEFDEAKLILVNTSAFINYIISTKK